MNLNVASIILSAGILAKEATAQLRAPAHVNTPRRLDDCTQDEDLVERYGEQLCPDEIAEKFEAPTDQLVAAPGELALQPGFKGFSVEFQTYDKDGADGLTWEQVQSVCLTECDKSPKCDFVTICPCPLIPGNFNDTCEVDKWACLSYVPAFKPGGQMVDVPDEGEVPGGFPQPSAVTYTKAGLSTFPPYESCDVSVLTLEAGIGCIIGKITDASLCGSILTDDFYSYVVPAIGCYSQAAPAKFQSCLACLIEKNGAPGDICSEDDDPNNIYRGACGVECFDETTADCEDEIKTALLCVANGAFVQFGGREYGGDIGGIGSDPYVCPAN
mmetsp:Transcript_24058/g.51018  ORF Transcript_24058/g.51018 Transcript_24058/m.51018 type:complete len:329 (+) Transcript_24058:63-1049(+)